MPSRTPKRDVSLSWPRCLRPGCGARHVSHVDCPPRGVWLVARNCPACRGATYCRRHCAQEYGRPVLSLVGKPPPAPEPADTAPARPTPSTDAETETEPDRSAAAGTALRNGNAPRGGLAIRGRGDHDDSAKTTSGVRLPDNGLPLTSPQIDFTW